MKNFKKNQVIIYVFALMLVVAGYFNFTTTNDLNNTLQTSASEEELMKMANIGDAQFVSSGIYSEENKTDNNEVVKDEKIVDTNSDLKDASDYFVTSKLERDTMYSQMIETYENMLNSGNALETQKQSAQEEITKINNVKNSIMISENLIKTKGIKNVVIFVNDDSVSVIVEDEQLEKEKVAQIQNIVSRELKVNAENINISSK